jgi:hypothetical protein
MLNNNLYQTEIVGYVLCSEGRQARPGSSSYFGRENVDAIWGTLNEYQARLFVAEKARNWSGAASVICRI